MKKYPIYIFGKKPPPIGGVTVYVDRLLNRINADSDLNSPIFIESSRENLLSLLFRRDLEKGIIHINVSDSRLLALIIFISKLKGFKTVFTLHRNYDREKNLKKRALIYALKNADVPLLLNTQSLDFGKKYNPNAKLNSSFIQFESLPSLPKKWEQAIALFTSNFQRTFCTNAFDYVHDHDGQEIYQILALIDEFSTIPEHGLVICDPSGSYARELQNKNLPKNIFLISEIVPFTTVINISDGLIRITTTDGDSTSIREALHLNKPVFCSNVVKRPLGCTVVESMSELRFAIKKKEIKDDLKNKETVDAYFHVKESYQKLAQTL